MKRIVFFVSLWTLILGSSLMGYSASAEEIISIAAHEYSPWTGIQNFI